MAQKIRYDDLVFDADLTSARRGDLAPIRFTHMERNLLSEFMRNPGRLLSRARLMQALAEHREESSDRSVDFFVSRLRRKLCDNASRPRFIVTRYGEGYIWIATPSETDPAPQAFVVFGPVYGFHASEAAPHLLRQLCGKLDAMLGSGQRVHLSPAWRVQEAEPNAGRFRIETALHRGKAILHAAFVLYESGQADPLESLRFDFADAADTSVEAAAQILKASIWRRTTMTDGRVAAVAQQPAYLHMHDAMQLLTLSSQYWLENDAQLRQALEAAPADPRLMVLLANNRMTTSLLNPAAGALQPELLRAAEKESETLVLAAVENLQDQPNYLLAAARVLLMLGSGWLELAESLVDRAFQTGTSFAAVFALRAQIHAARGETAQALEMYDKALEMSLPQSEFRVYLLVLKICALLASGNYKAVQRLTPELYREKPLTRMQLGVQLTPPDATLDADLQHLLAGIGVLNAAVMTRHAYYMGARRMLHPEHRENMMRGLIQRVIHQYGPSAIPEDIRAALPGLIGE